MKPLLDLQPTRWDSGRESASGAGGRWLISNISKMAFPSLRSELWGQNKGTRSTGNVTQETTRYNTTFVEGGVKDHQNKHTPIRRLLMKSD